MVQLLLAQKNIKINFQAKNGYTALMRAVYRGQFEVAKLLFEHEADVHVRNTQTGLTVIDLVTMQLHPQNIVGRND